MASSGQAVTPSREPFVANAPARKKDDTPEAPPEEETTVTSRDDDAQRILCQLVKTEHKRRKKPWSQEATQAVVLGAILFGGLAAFIGLLIMQ